ncbi:MAG: RNA 2',3'-cyclic phosphodiesterase [Alphaproteobacteria bacterium]
MSLRLFVAIALPAEIKTRLASLCGGLAEAKWVPEPNFHLTLRFIGSVDEVMADDIMAALDSVRAPAFSIDLDGIGHFGNAHQVRTLWVRAASNPALDHLVGKIESALVRCGLAPESRKFTAHVTLARFNRLPSPERLGTWIAAHNLFRAGPIAVNRFALFSSTLSADGSTYHVEAEFRLDGGWQDDAFAK